MCATMLMGLRGLVIGTKAELKEQLEFNFHTLVMATCRFFVYMAPAQGRETSLQRLPWTRTMRSRDFLNIVPRLSC